MQKSEKNEQQGWKLPSPEPDELDTQMILAEKIVNNIENWLESKRELHGRIITPGDIMILLRKRGCTTELHNSGTSKQGNSCNTGQ